LSSHSGTIGPSRTRGMVAIRSRRSGGRCGDGSRRQACQRAPKVEGSRRAHTRSRASVNRRRPAITSGCGIGRPCPTNAPRLPSNRRLRVELGRAEVGESRGAFPSRASRMFCGFTSRWRIPCRWRRLQGVGDAGGRSTPPRPALTGPACGDAKPRDRPHRPAPITTPRAVAFVEQIVDRHDVRGATGTATASTLAAQPFAAANWADERVEGTRSLIATAGADRPVGGGVDDRVAADEPISRPISYRPASTVASIEVGAAHSACMARSAESALLPKKSRVVYRRRNASQVRAPPRRRRGRPASTPPCRRGRAPM